ncbi:MAG: exodeoxyribonuclease VII large subunit [Clostridia bacterium]|nr:exodeoxyribonuclease VII large subunit [Clostridia bacterium]
MEKNKTFLSVSQLNEYLRLLMDGDRVLSSVWIRGEISNFKYYASSGHLYFTLKDPEGQLKSVMFRTYAQRLSFRPEDGLKVLAHGRVSVYSQSGQYQLYVDEMQPDGAGALALQYEQLRRKLEAEGLFDETRKQPLPPMPKRIGVITSPSGAAVHDIRNILARRFPCAEMILFPSAVQGAEAPEQLRLGIEFFSMTKMCDVIIIGRGGGSAEDLWAFNDEMLARAIAACPIPVISAVGHESDFTICDFVADRRAPTPSAAAELAVPDRTELAASLGMTFARINALVAGRITQEKRVVSQIASSPYFRRPEMILDGFRQRLLQAERRIGDATEKKLERCDARLSNIAARLEAMSPLSVLSRGYAAVAREGKTLTRAAQIFDGDTLELRFADGSVRAVARKEKGNMEYGNEKNDL